MFDYSYSEGLYSAVFAENLVSTVESLSKIIAEIKLSVILNDHKSRNQIVMKREKVLDDM